MYKFKWIGMIVLALILIVVSACSAQNSEESADSENSNTESAERQESEAGYREAEKNQDSSKGVSDDQSNVDVNLANQDNKMIIYNANVSIETDDYDDFHSNLEKLIKRQMGYIVQSNVRNEHEENRYATIQLRVPKNNFFPFVNGLNEFDAKINNKQISGRDVTKEYVDLESRLKAKKKVESRLLSFLDRAKKTEDLIQISKDLERVQEDIEVIQGKMNYLKNQSDFSTITLEIRETKVIVPKLEQEELNTWQKAKKTFMGSINNVTKFFSFLFIALVGLSPIFVIISTLAILLFFVIRKFKKQSSSYDNDDS